MRKWEVHCHVGSLEKYKGMKNVEGVVHCHVGSLEKTQMKPVS